MEQLCRLVCNKVYTSTREGYGIFYEDELLDLLPEDNRTRETLEAILKQLSNEGFVDVKYAKGNAFCMLGVKQYAKEEAPAPPSHKILSGLGSRTFAALAALSFLGGAAGGLLGAVLGYAL